MRFSRKKPEAVEPPTPEPISTGPQVAVELTREEKAAKYLAAVREWHDADAALTEMARRGFSPQEIAEAQLRLNRAEMVRCLVERYADCADDAAVAAITGTGVHGITARPSEGKPLV